MKKIACMAMMLVLCLCTVSCAGYREAEKDGLNITVTVFPVYDWVMHIAGDTDGVHVILLEDSGTDMHSFQPSAQDIRRLTSPDMTVYIGGESELWVKEALKADPGDGRRDICLIDMLEETVLWEEDDGSPDEHIWLSVRNAEKVCEVLCSEICMLDPAHEDAYRANTEAYCRELRALDAAYTEVTDSSAGHTLLFADRFPFGYLARDYGLECLAAFTGCSAETEASFETVAYLAEKMDTLHLPCILTLEKSDHRLAETILQNTEDSSRPILELDSMQSVNEKEIKAGASWLSVMESNLDILKEALR